MRRQMLLFGSVVLLSCLGAFNVNAQEYNPEARAVLGDRIREGQTWLSAHYNADATAETLKQLKSEPGHPATDATLEQLKDGYSKNEQVVYMLSLLKSRTRYSEEKFIKLLRVQAGREFDHEERFIQLQTSKKLDHVRRIDLEVEGWKIGARMDALVGIINKMRPHGMVPQTAKQILLGEKPKFSKSDQDAGGGSTEASPAPQKRTPGL